MNDLLNWIFSDAGAGWVFGVVSLVALIVTRKRDFRPLRVVVEEKLRREPLLVREEVRERICITFDGKEVEKLAQISLEIFNEGKATITNPAISLCFPESIDILDAYLENKDHGAIEVEQNVVIITFKYLNAAKEHNHVERITLIANGAFGQVSVSGGGEGWSIRHLSLPTPEAANRRSKIFIFGTAALLPAAFIYGYWLEAYYKIPMSEFSWRAFIANSPVLIPIVLWMAYGYKKLLRAS